MALPEEKRDKGTKVTDIRPYQNPFRALRQEMDELIDRFFADDWFMGRSLAGESVKSAEGKLVVPEIDVLEKKDKYVITAELPGITSDDTEIRVENGMLLLKGEKKSSYESEDVDTHIVERRYGSFERRLPLPRGVDEAKIKAEFDDGVLTITLPKLKEDRRESRTIKIT